MHAFSVAMYFITSSFYLLLSNHNEVRNILSDRAVSCIMYLV